VLPIAFGMSRPPMWHLHNTGHPARFTCQDPIFRS
jgi:hypothetical protein